jgi:hypothetical protein
VNHRYRLENGDLLEETGWATSSYFSLDELGRLELTDGAWIEPRTFVLYSALGEVKQQFGHDLSDCALDDYLYITGLHYVADETLWRGMIEIGGAFHFHIRLATPDLQLTGLTIEAS